MNKKTKIIVSLAVAVLILVAVFVIFTVGRSAEKQDETAAAENPVAEDQNADGKSPDTAAQTKPAEPTPDAEKAQETVTESAQLIETDGDITIIIPEDEESDGF